MATSKVMPSSNSRNSDLSRRSSSRSPSTKSQQKFHNDQYNIQQSIADRSDKIIYSDRNGQFTSKMTIDGILRNVYDSNPQTESTLLDASITLIEAPAPSTITAVTDNTNQQQYQNAGDTMNMSIKSVDEVWREIVSGERKEMKEEAADELMTLEDFLAKAGVVDEVTDEMDVKVHPERLSGGLYSFDSITTNPFQVLDKVEGSIVGFGNGVDVIGGGSASSGGGRGKRGRMMMEPLDKAGQQRQKRMIKNRESAARSRERKQAYQVELESLAVKLELENQRLLKEKAERTRKRFKELMENVIPVVEKRRPTRSLRRVKSLQW